MNSLMRQFQGTMVAQQAIPAAVAKQNKKVHLKRLNTRGASSKKPASSTSLFVDPQDMSMPKAWDKMAWETWIEIPPMKTVMRGSHLRFSKTNNC